MQSAPPGLVGLVGRKASPSSPRRRTSSPPMSPSTCWNSWGCAKPLLYSLPASSCSSTWAACSRPGRWSRLRTCTWADPQSRGALLVATRRLSQDRVIMVVTSRPQPARDDGWERFTRGRSPCLLDSDGVGARPDPVTGVERSAHQECLVDAVGGAVLCQVGQPPELPQCHAKLAD